LTGARYKQRGGQPGHGGFRIVIAGTGGQGVLTAARLLCEYFAARGHQVVSGQLHGMAQRGGSVQSTVMIDAGISPVIPRGRADVVVGFEPVETVRALPLMSLETVVLMNTSPVVPYVIAQAAVRGNGEVEYPAVEGLVECVRGVTERVFAFDGTGIAQECGSGRTLNVIMLGCLLGSGLLPCAADDFWRTATRGMPKHLLETNARAFTSGVESGRRFAFGPAG